jgi:hypothetical protein
MIYLLDMDYKIWAEKHGIEPISFTCPECEKSFLTSVPAYSKLSYGLAVPEHGCSQKNRAHVLVPRDEETRTLLLDTLSKIQQG